jgi:hypothetical protein
LCTHYRMVWRARHYQSCVEAAEKTFVGTRGEALPASWLCKLHGCPDVWVPTCDGPRAPLNDVEGVNGTPR